MSEVAAPSHIRLREQGSLLQLEYASGEVAELSAEFLRVQSPSAEVRGHGGSGGELPVGKRRVKIVNVRHVGRYAIGIDFNDGHDSGIYTWEYLRHLQRHQSKLWDLYVAKLRELGKGRDPEEQILRLIEPSA